MTAPGFAGRLVACGSRPAVSANAAVACEDAVEAAVVGAERNTSPAMIAPCTTPMTASAPATHCNSLNSGRRGRSGSSPGSSRGALRARRSSRPATGCTVSGSRASGGLLFATLGVDRSDICSGFTRSINARFASTAERKPAY